MDVKIELTWKKELAQEFSKPYFNTLISFVKSAYQTTTVYPPGRLIFNAFNHCPFDQTKVVILGQDPYHGAGQANGLSFSVNPGIPKPPSLKNIYKELSTDMGIAEPKHGDLTNWAKQGVLLLNSMLSVQASKPGSHQNKGWETFTDAVIKLLSDKKTNVVFILWGAYAQKKGAVINEDKHMVIRSAHPSPFSAHRGFLGSRPFSKTNQYLSEHNIAQIDWRLQ